MDLFEFPFHSDVWGTASEWVMIIVTSITAIFLYKTLKSQKEVQKTQNRLLQIEQLRLREDYRPELAYSRYYDAKIPVKPIEHLISIAIRNVSNNPVRNLRLEYPKTENIVGNAMTVNDLKNLIKGAEYASLHLIFKSFDENVLKEGFDFKVIYEDLVGFQYQQTVICSFKDRETIFFGALEPQLIKLMVSLKNL